MPDGAFVPSKTHACNGVRAVSCMGGGIAASWMTPQNLLYCVKSRLPFWLESTVYSILCDCPIGKELWVSETHVTPKCTSKMTGRWENEKDKKKGGGEAKIA